MLYSQYSYGVYKIMKCYASKFTNLFSLKSSVKSFHYQMTKSFIKTTEIFSVSASTTAAGRAKTLFLISSRLDLENMLFERNIFG